MNQTHVNDEAMPMEQIPVRGEDQEFIPIPRRRPMEANEGAGWEID
jgi:hypothetical protein